MSAPTIFAGDLLLAAKVREPVEAIVRRWTTLWVFKASTNATQSVTDRTRYAARSTHDLNGGLLQNIRLDNARNINLYPQATASQHLGVK